MNICLSSSHEPIDSGPRLLSQALAESLRCSCSNCVALSLDPPLTITAVRKSSSQILLVELGDVVADFEAFRQWGSADVEAETLCAAQLIMVYVCDAWSAAAAIVGVKNPTIFALCTSPINFVLGEGVPEFSIDWLHAMRSWCNGGRSRNFLTSYHKSYDINLVA
jgi:hypothetical protein